MITHPMDLIGLGLFSAIAGGAAFVAISRFAAHSQRSVFPPLMVFVACGFVDAAIFVMAGWQ